MGEIFDIFGGIIIMFLLFAFAWLLGKGKSNSGSTESCDDGDD